MNRAFFLPRLAGRRMNLMTSVGCRFGCGLLPSLNIPSLVISLITNNPRRSVDFIFLLAYVSMFSTHANIA